MLRLLLTWHVCVGGQQYYRGSLTIPDCDERVTWLVLAHTMTALPEQIQEFTKIYPHINRYQQPTTRTAHREHAHDSYLGVVSVSVCLCV